MSLNLALTHEDLLTLARKTEAAARDGDRYRLETAALRLFEALIDHLGAERPALLQLPPGEARRLLRGQQRVIDMLVDLAIAAETPEPCRCDSLAEQLLAQLTLQADDEHRSLAATALPLS
jgi:hypothetical protein